MEEEDTHYCLKCGTTVIGIENYITHRKVSCESVVDNKIGINMGEDDDKNKESENVQADDFFSSLELQSSSKTSSNIISLSFPNKLSGGIVTRSKSLNAAHTEVPKIENPVPAPKPKYNKKKPNILKKKKGKKKEPKQTESITVDEIGAFLKKSDDLDDKCPDFEKKDDDEWLLFSHLGLKKSTTEEMDDKEAKRANEQQAKRYTPELFSMSPILMPDVLSEGKDDVGNFLEDDYDDSYLHIDEMDEFNYAPPRSHTGGKWKPGSLSMRASPILWPGQTWMTLLDDKHQDEDGKTLDESSNDKKEMKPPPTHTGGKWKPSAPPATHTGGKWKPSEVPQIVKTAPPATHTGGKWKPETRSVNEPPATHTGGKWKPHPGPTHTSGKWKPEEEPIPRSVDKSTMNAIASAQSTSGKFLKTAGGSIQYYCAPCDRRLASKKMYKKHVLSELHFKRVLQENDLEFDSRSLKIFRGLFTAVGYKERGLGKRVIKKPEHFKNMDMSTGKRIKELKSEKILKRKKIAKRELIRCEVCKTKLPNHQLGKHLVSYYHSRRIQLNDPNQQKLVLDNINAIVQQAPFQCGICKFYCNTHLSFKKHWKEGEHKDEGNKKFWCSFCNFECTTSHMMGLHLDSNSHREVISAVNKSIPIIIRQKTILNCKLCSKTFRFNRGLIRHNQIRHGVNESEHTKQYRCPVCKFKTGGMKSLQRHIILSHKSNKKTPYFCTVCKIAFKTADESASHRKTQYHKCKTVMKNSDLGKEEDYFMSRLCQYCGKIQDDILKLKEHINEEHPSVRPKCLKCGKVFTLPQEVSRHIRDNLCDFSQEENQDDRKKTHKCTLCKYTSESKSELLFHQAMHDKVNIGKNIIKLRCPLCQKFFRRFALKVHLRSHTGERPFLCKFCPRSFVRRDRLNLHLKGEHAKQVEKMVEEENSQQEKEAKNEESGQSEEEVSDDKDEEQAKCGDPNCKYTPKDYEDLAQHIKIHVGPNTFQCPQCVYKAKTNTLYKRHNKIHLDERSFPCPHCPFRGRLASHLKRHLRLHTGAKPYQCPHCPYKCNILENLRKHVLFTKIHPGKFLYDCKFCSFGTNSAKDFKWHLHGEHFDHFQTDHNIATYIAGIYNQDEDPQHVDKPLKVKTKSAPSPKLNRPEILKKVSILTRKMEKIQPKPSPFVEKKIITPNLSLKSIGNSVEDKRKLLEMELGKLREQAKKQWEKAAATATTTTTPTATTATTILKSYPPSAAFKAEKDTKTKLPETDENLELNLNSTISSKNVAVLAENNLIYLTIPSSVVSVENETDEFVLTPDKTNLEVFEGNTSPTYIFYDESDMITEESEEMLVGEEFYVLQD